MNKRAKIVKDIVKPEVAPKSTFGTDPNDPWSTKANISETNYLDAFLRRRGLNPKHVSKNQKVAHSKTGDFKKWVAQHVHGGKLPTFDDPMREDVGRNIHQVGNEVTSHVPSPTRMRQKQIKKISTKHNVISSVGTDGLHKEEVDKKDTVTFDIPLLIRMLELAREDIKSDAELHKVVEKLIQIRKNGILTMDDYEFVSNVKESLEIFEDTYQDSYAATQTVGMENSQQDEPNSPGLKRLKGKKMSEASRIVKEIYKSHRVSEDMYAWDAEDKDTKQPLGKKPKFLKTSDMANMGENKPKCAAIVTGGKTMTGETRDDIEIDPMMKHRPGSPQGHEPTAPTPKAKKK